LTGRYLLHRLIVIEAISFALLIFFISLDDEWIIPHLVSKDFPFTPASLAVAIDSIWVACLFALALYIQLKYLQKIRLLEGMLSVCASCKKIRDGEEHWTPMEEYIQKRSHADFTHTICPDCGVKLYGDLYLQAVQRDIAGP
jgi:hypothetical protein